MASPARTKLVATQFEQKQRTAAAVFAEREFLRILHLEQKRTERSRRPFILMLIEFPDSFGPDSNRVLLQQVMDTVADSARETDVTGWYEQDSVVGAIFTELGEGDTEQFVDAIETRYRNALAEVLDVPDYDRVQLSLHAYPEKPAVKDHTGVSELWNRGRKPRNSRLVLGMKRAIDILGSLCAILILLPICAVIAAAIKLTSKGPVLFRQQRVGQYGRKFTFLKFRSMKVANDPSIHQKFVESFIAGTAAKAEGGKVFKLVADPRITPIGRFLRRTSLDELPQFLNVLLGDMALVGPRPPIPYEVNKYDLWHRRRYLSVKPGITGLWQVTGRSRTTFDEMVRMDLRYAKSWSLWMDVKILFMTPLAVFRGDGAY